MEFYGSNHNHTDRSNYRLRDSTNRLDELCWYAADVLKHDFIAITDHETISTAIDCQKVEKEIREKYPNFKVIRGNEIYLCRNGLNKDNYIKGEDKFYHFILLAKDEIGHEQLRILSTRAWDRLFKQGKMQRVPTYYSDLQEVIGKNSGHVIFSSACLGGRLPQLILDYNKNPSDEKWDYIISWIEHISDICGRENFFLEAQPSKNKEQIIVNQTYKKLSEILNIPVVISLDAHYLKKEDEPIHHAFLTAQEGDRETADFYATTYMMSREEIHSYMDNSLGVETVSLWLNNSKKIYDMCEDYDLTRPTRIVYIPKTIDRITYEQFLAYKDKIKELEYFYTSEHQENRDLAAAIVKKIYDDPEQYDNQLTYEAIDDNLKAVRLASEKMNTQWSAYLLNLRDYIKIIWNQGNSLTGCSRGCFYPDEKVLLANGQEKSICQIKIGDLVFNHNGEINKVQKILRYKINEECYIIKGEGKESIHCTNNHKFYIKRCSNEQAEFIRADEIKVGDLIAYPKPKLKPLEKDYIDFADYLDKRRKYSIKDKYISYYIENNGIKRKNKIRRFVPINSELAYFCGILISRGWWVKEKGKIGIYFDLKNGDKYFSFERCQRFLDSIEAKYIAAEPQTKKAKIIYIYSEVLQQFIKKNIEKASFEKYICDWLITSNKAITKNLLAGLMSSDNSFSSTNLDLIKQAQMLWASIGTFRNYTIETLKNEKIYKWEKNREQNYIEDKDCYYTTVENVSIEKYKGYVYDLSVENIHSYVINGTSVHNSGTGFLLLNMLGVTQINPLRETTKTYSFRFLNPERVSPLD